MNVAEYERSLHLPKNYSVIKKGFSNFDSQVPRCACARVRVCAHAYAREKQAEERGRKNTF